MSVDSIDYIQIANRTIRKASLSFMYIKFFVDIQIDLIDALPDFQSVQDLPKQEQDLMCYLLQIKYMRS